MTRSTQHWQLVILFFYSLASFNTISQWRSSFSIFLGQPTRHHLGSTHLALSSPRAQQVSQELIAAVITSHLKFCACDKEEPTISFHLFEAQFAVAGFWTQKFKYAKTFANLSKQVLQDILNKVNACNESNHTFDDLKHCTVASKTNCVHGPQQQPRPKRPLGSPWPKIPTQGGHRSEAVYDVPLVLPNEFLNFLQIK